MHGIRLAVMLIYLDGEALCPVNTSAYVKFVVEYLCRKTPYQRLPLYNRDSLLNTALHRCKRNVLLHPLREIATYFQNLA